LTSNTAGNPSFFSGQQPPKFPQVPKVTDYEAHELHMEEINRFHDREVVDAVNSVIKYYNIRLAQLSELKIVLAMM
jgi:hypothetical protein